LGVERGANKSSVYTGSRNWRDLVEGQSVISMLGLTSYILCSIPRFPVIGAIFRGRIKYLQLKIASLHLYLTQHL